MANNDYYTRLASTSGGGISIAVPQVDFPDPAAVTAVFNYNFFRPDEMVVESAAVEIQDPTSEGELLGKTYVASRTRSALDPTSTSEQDEGYFSVQTQRFPMYNSVQWTPVVIDNPPVDQALVDDVASRLEELVHLAESEESFSSAIYTGYTVSPINVYEALVLFLEALSNISSTPILQALTESTAEGRVFSSTITPYQRIEKIYNIIFNNEIGYALSYDSGGESVYTSDLETFDSSMIVQLTSYLVSQFANYQTAHADDNVSSFADFYDNPGFFASYGKYFTDIAIDYAFTSENNVSFGSTIHNSLYYDVVKGAAQDYLSWHQPSAKGAKGAALDIALGTNNSSTGATGGMFPVVNPVSVVFDEDTSPNPSADNEVAISAVGYVVEKYVASSDSIGEVGGQDDVAGILISPYADGNQLNDSDLTYGHAYNYSVRAVYLVQVPIINRSLIDPSDDQFGYAYILVTSKPNFSNGVQAVDNVPPPPPGNLEFIYDYSDKTLFMHWEFPTNKQEDIVAFQVFRRETTDDPFELIAQYDFDNSVIPYRQQEQMILPRLIRSDPGKPVVSHTDFKFKKDSKYIYAVCSVDARRLSSGYSSQYEVSFDRYRNKLEVRRSSFPGAPKPYPNLYIIKDTFKDTIQTSEYDDFYIFFDPDAYYISDSAGTNLNLISTSVPDQPKPTYHMNVINLDMQKSQTVDITINDDDNYLKELEP